jgi:GNAT superfamily N-acetyltransferase
MPAAPVITFRKGAAVLPTPDARLLIRPATPADVPVILRFIRELAEYERALHEVHATEADLLRDGWGLASDGQTPLTPPFPPRFRVIMADWRTAPHCTAQPAGFALFFTSYSTWLGHHGIRLEDLFVTPALRGHGIGKALLRELARIAVSEGCERLEWDVLTWNAPAIAVYERVGATTQEEWRIMRLSGDALRSFVSAEVTPELQT